MTSQHCPGFESNKTLKPVKMKCPECGKEAEIFSEEREKGAKCSVCKATFDPNTRKTK